MDTQKKRITRSSNLFYLSVFLFLASNLQGQVFVTGAIQAHGYEEHGLLAYKVVKKKPVLFFKAVKDQPARKIDLASIDGFYFNEYKGHFVVRTDSAKNVWVGRLVSRGAVSVFNNRDYYLLVKEGTGEELVLAKHVHDDVKSNVLLRIRNSGRLHLFLDSCKDEIHPKSILRSVENHNTCTNSIVKMDKHAKIKPKIIAGLNTTHASFSGNLEYLNKATFSPELGYHFGLGITRLPNYYLPRKALNVELVYMRSKVTGHADYSVSGPRSVHDITIESSMLRLPISLNIFFRQAHRGLYISPGVIPYYFLDYSAAKTSWDVLESGSVINERTDDDIFSLYKTNRYNAGVFLEVGYRLHHAIDRSLNVSFRFEYETGRLDATAPITTTIFHRYLTLQYQL